MDSFIDQPESFELARQGRCPDCGMRLFKEGERVVCPNSFRKFKCGIETFRSFITKQTT